MPFYDSSGRLKVTFPGASSSAGINVYNTGTLITAGAVGLNFTSSYLGTTITTANNIVTVSYDPRTILGVSGFKHSSAGTDGAYYFAPNYNSLTGSTTEAQMIAVLYKVLYYDAGASLVSKMDSDTGQGWRLVSHGYEYAAQSCGYGVTALNGYARRDFGFPGEDKWILAVGCSDSTTLYLYINGTAAASIFSPIGSVVNNVPFMIGANGTTAATSGSENSGDGTVVIAAVAINTGSYNLFARNQYSFYKKCNEAGDIVQDDTMDWHHIWSVKQNPPNSSTWPATVGNIDLITTGVLTFVTDSHAHWL